MNELSNGDRVRAAGVIRLIGAGMIAAGAEGTIVDVGPVVMRVHFDGHVAPCTVAPHEIASAPVDRRGDVDVRAARAGAVRFTQPDATPGAL